MLLSTTPYQLSRFETLSQTFGSIMSNESGQWATDVLILTQTTAQANTWTAIPLTVTGEALTGVPLRKKDGGWVPLIPSALALVAGGSVVGLHSNNSSQSRKNKSI